MLEWLFWEQYSHEPYIAVARFQVRFLGKARRRARAPADGARERRPGSGWSDGLAAAPFLVGEALTLADVALVAYTRVAARRRLRPGRLSARCRPGSARVEEALGIAA